MITLFINGQRLKIESPLIVAGSIDYLSAQFCFQSSDWDGLEKWAHFENGDTVYDIKLVDDRIEKDKHLNLTEGEWSIWVHGSEYVDGEMKMRITTAAVRLVVLPTGTTDTDNPFPSAEPSVVEQIYADLDGTVRSAVDNAIPGAVDDALEKAKASGEFDGADGAPGADGKDGAEGKSAYRSALDNGFEGTEAEWLESLKGEAGDSPVKGEDYYTEEDKAEIIADMLTQVPQPDWNQNDETQPDYVKNRTHWIEVGGVTEILPETSPTYSEEEGSFLLTDALALEVGSEYTVTWNGAEYNCTGGLYEEAGLTGVVLGNIGLMTGGADTGEPFIIVALSPETAAEIGVGTLIAPLDESTELTLSITCVTGDIYHKLDNKYLDLDWLPTIDIVENEAVPETTVTVSTSGTSTDIAYDTFTEGMDTVVTWDGTKYNCTVKKTNIDGVGVVVYIGNLGENTGEPFVFASMSGTAYRVSASTAGEHTYSISTLDKVYNTIPEGFLSDDTDDVLEIDLSEMGMEDITESSTVQYSVDTSEALYALQTGKKVIVSFRAKFPIVGGGGSRFVVPKITLNRSGSGTLTSGYGSSIENLDYNGVNTAALTSVYLDNNGVTVCAYRLADLIDERISATLTDGDEVSY